MDIAKMKMYYQKELWKKAMVDNLLKLGKITEEEYKKIVGDSEI